MTQTPDQARQQLADSLARGFELKYTPPALTSGDGMRRSSVLILFGALDRVPASHSSGPVAPELDVLLTRRADHMRHHPGQIAFPGGGVEVGDRDRAHTALREAEEETGLDPSGIDVLGNLPELHLPVSSNLVTPVLGWWRKASEVAADHSESVEVFRVPVAELLDPAARGTSVLKSPGGTFRGAAFKLSPRFGGHVVWGFTGMLLASIFEGVGWEQPWDAGRTFGVGRIGSADTYDSAIDTLSNDG